MGEARRRGSFRERKQKAIEGGRVKRDRPKNQFYKKLHGLSETEGLAAWMALMAKAKKTRIK